MTKKYLKNFIVQQKESAELMIESDEIESKTDYFYKGQIVLCDRIIKLLKLFI